MSIIYVDAEEPVASILRRRMFMVLGILLVVTAANVALFLAAHISQSLAYPLPRPAITLLTRSRLHAGQVVAFSAVGSQGRELRYLWSFGDGQTVQTTRAGMVTHVYPDSGRYTVTLTAVDPVNHQAQRSLTITILPPLPVAAFAVQRNPYQPLTMTFDASRSTGSDRRLYRWDFGDGETAITQDPITSYTYPHLGTFIVTLTVTDDAGQTARVSEPVQVLPPPPMGEINGDYLGTAGQPVMLYFAPDPLYTANQPGPLTYSWNFGDGQISTAGPKVIHIYAQAGAYQITLIVSDRYGQSSRFQTSLVVNQG
jgi:hypothetical protein